MRTNNILTGLMVIIITISCTIESATPSIEDKDMTNGSKGGRVDYHRAFRNDLQWN